MTRGIAALLLVVIAGGSLLIWRAIPHVPPYSSPKWLLVDCQVKAVRVDPNGFVNEPFCVELSWKPVDGAYQYFIYVDNKLAWRVAP